MYLPVSCAPGLNWISYEIYIQYVHVHTGARSSSLLYIGTYTHSTTRLLHTTQSLEISTQTCRIGYVTNQDKGFIV